MNEQIYNAAGLSELDPEEQLLLMDALASGKSPSDLVAEEIQRRGSDRRALVAAHEHVYGLGGSTANVQLLSSAINNSDLHLQMLGTLFATSPNTTGVKLIDCDESDDLTQLKGLVIVGCRIKHSLTGFFGASHIDGGYLQEVKNRIENEFEVGFFSGTGNGDIKVGWDRLSVFSGKFKTIPPVQVTKDLEIKLRARPSANRSDAGSFGTPAAVPVGRSFVLPGSGSGWQLDGQLVFEFAAYANGNAAA